MLKAWLPLHSDSVHCHSSQQRRDEMTQTRSHVHSWMFTVQVPRSSKLIYEDNDYALYSVTLFKRVADSFKQAARSKGFQVHMLINLEALKLLHNVFSVQCAIPLSVLPVQCAIPLSALQCV